ncbi:hypothetical protein [Vallitalea okinawensis]|uniref:hypothetical protein n=1 Tax=Vallitalea okinawensis TaxID=2078660 RepID=UPI000CFC00D1|nr:hypothetical protein [Vallitalea okinawensis]
MLNKRIMTGIVLAIILVFTACSGNQENLESESRFSHNDEQNRVQLAAGTYENEDFDDDMSFDDYLEYDLELKAMIEENRDAIPKDTYDKLIQLCDQMIEADKKEDFDKGTELYEEIDGILAELDITFDEQGSENIIKEYDVVNGQIDIEVEKDEFNIHKLLWNKVTKIYPQKYEDMIRSFEIASDGYNGTMGATAPMDDSKQTFLLSLDLADSFDANGYVSDDELTHTLIHELGHIITLNGEQVEELVDETSKNYTIQEGTTKTKSYLNQFYQQFWSKINDEYMKIQDLGEEDPEQAEEEAMKFYEKYQDQFVSDYASSDPVEDIAESFIHFVLKDKPAGKTIADKKVLFFYEYEELIKVRDEIRTSLAN